MARGKRGSSVAARRSSPRLNADAEIVLPSSITQSSRHPRTRGGGNAGAGQQNIEPPNVTNEAPNGNAERRSGPRTSGGMATRAARTARGVTEAQWGVEGLNNFIEMQSRFMERQIEILEKQSEATEKLSKALGVQKKTKAVGSDFEKFKKWSPPSFEGGSDPTVAQEWLKKMEKYFRALGCSEEQKVIYATFMLEGDAEIWWETKEASLSLEGEDIPWSRFVNLFREKYFPLYVRSRKKRELMDLQQGDMTVEEYEAKFNELSRYAPELVAEEFDKVEMFENGLRPEIHKKVTVVMSKTFEEAVERAKRAEKASKGEKIADEPNKSWDQKKRFRDDSNQKDKSAFRPFKKPVFRGSGAPVQRSGQFVQRTGPPIQKHDGQCYRCGKNHKGRVCSLFRGCFECGQQGHIMRDCPAKKGAKPDDQKMKSTPVDSQKPKTQGRVFALTKQDALASNSVVTGALVISSQLAHVLFDSGSSHSFISHSFASKLGRTSELLGSELLVSTPAGDCMITNHIFKGCEVIVGDRTLPANLVLLDIHDFDVILGMDWLAAYHASLDCFQKRVSFRIPGESEFYFEGSGISVPPCVISAMRACRLLRKGCQGYLASIIYTEKKEVTLDEIPIVRE